MKIVVCGMSGLIGRPLTTALLQKHELVVLRRKLAPAKSAYSGREVLWNPPYLSDNWTKEINGASAVINLSGEPIAGKHWTADQKKELRNSRIHTTRAILAAIAQARVKPKILINASAIGFYGPRDSTPVDETTGGGSGFLAELCREWETEALKAKEMGVRTALLRTGIVLAKEGGALAKILPIFKLGAGGPLGSGKQFMSWIHIEDEVGAVVKILEDPSIEGPVNLTAPQPVTMAQFALALGKAVKRPARLPVPGFVLKLLLGEMSEMLLTGQNVYPKKLTKAGFKFKYPSLEPALMELLL